MLHYLIFSWRRTEVLLGTVVSQEGGSSQSSQMGPDRADRCSDRLRRTMVLSTLTRFRGGAASYFEVLTNDGNSFSAQLSLVAEQPKPAARGNPAV